MCACDVHMHASVRACVRACVRAFNRACTRVCAYALGAVELCLSFNDVLAKLLPAKLLPTVQSQPPARGSMPTELFLLEKDFSFLKAAQPDGYFAKTGGEAAGDLSGPKIENLGIACCSFSLA